MNSKRMLHPLTRLMLLLVPFFPVYFSLTVASSFQETGGTQRQSDSPLQLETPLTPASIAPSPVPKGKVQSYYHRLLPGLIEAHRIHFPPEYELEPELVPRTRNINTEGPNSSGSGHGPPTSSFTGSQKDWTASDPSIDSWERWKSLPFPPKFPADRRRWMRNGTLELGEKGAITSDLLYDGSNPNDRDGGERRTEEVEFLSSLKKPNNISILVLQWSPPAVRISWDFDENRLTHHLMRKMVSKKLEAFRITYHPINSKYRMIQEVSPSARNLTLDRLRPNTEYLLRVYPLFENEVIGPHSHSIRFISPDDEESRLVRKSRPLMKANKKIQLPSSSSSSHSTSGSKVQVEEVVIVGMIIFAWIAFIMLFIKKWGRIRTLEPRCFLSKDAFDGPAPVVSLNPSCIPSNRIPTSSIVPAGSTVGGGPIAVSTGTSGLPLSFLLPSFSSSTSSYKPGGVKRTFSTESLGRFPAWNRVRSTTRASSRLGAGQLNSVSCGGSNVHKLLTARSLGTHSTHCYHKPIPGHYTSFTSHGSGHFRAGGNVYSTSIGGSNSWNLHSFSSTGDESHSCAPLCGGDHTHHTLPYCKSMQEKCHVIENPMVRTPLAPTLSFNGVNEGQGGNCTFNNGRKDPVRRDELRGQIVGGTSDDGTSQPETTQGEQNKTQLHQDHVINTLLNDGPYIIKEEGGFMGGKMKEETRNGSGPHPNQHHASSSLWFQRERKRPQIYGTQESTPNRTRSFGDLSTSSSSIALLLMDPDEGLFTPSPSPPLPPPTVRALECKRSGILQQKELRNEVHYPKGAHPSFHHHHHARYSYGKEHCATKSAFMTQKTIEEKDAKHDEHVLATNSIPPLNPNEGTGGHQQKNVSSRSTEKREESVESNDSSTSSSSFCSVSSCSTAEALVHTTSSTSSSPTVTIREMDDVKCVENIEGIERVSKTLNSNQIHLIPC